VSGQRIRDKWRPPLGLIVFAVLLLVLVMAAGIVIAFRIADQTASRLGPVEMAALGTALLLTIVIAVVFSRTLTGPIEALIRTTRAIGQGDRSAISPPPRQGTREIATLTQSFLDLAERLVERNDYLQSFATHVSHELKSPLASIRGIAELMRDSEMSEAERRRFLDGMIAETGRMAALLDRLRELARAEAASADGAITLAELSSELALPRPALAIETSGEDIALPLTLEGARMVFGNLADNSVQHGASRLTLTGRQDARHCMIEVRDDGPGVSPGNRDRIFEPYFTTRREAGGTGLGLGIAAAVVASRGGTIRLLPDGPGAGFEVVLPLPQLR
jgi:two-component system, OmpR family, sensor kinase